MSTEMLLIAIGCGRLPQVLDIAAGHCFVVFGALDGSVFAGLAPRDAGRMPSLPVYFYETG
ncbi:MAG: hypothetical protein LJE96_10830 [Deltaproteobacteria bacterium]|nr:hypothetical protein [Deltaproteobacteria bacterium]